MRADRGGRRGASFCAPMRSVGTHSPARPQRKKRQSVRRGVGHSPGAGITDAGAQVVAGVFDGSPTGITDPRRRTGGSLRLGRRVAQRHPGDGQGLTHNAAASQTGLVSTATSLGPPAITGHIAQPSKVCGSWVMRCQSSPSGLVLAPGATISCRVLIRSSFRVCREARPAVAGRTRWVVRSHRSRTMRQEWTFPWSQSGARMGVGMASPNDRRCRCLEGPPRWGCRGHVVAAVRRGSLADRGEATGTADGSEVRQSVGRR